MTDKQIIIHGVDVSGCDRLNTFPMQYGEPHEICLTSLEQWGGQEKYCKDRPNCYYKKWQRKEQECERLKKWLPIVTRLENEFENFEKAKAIDYKSYIEQIFIELDKLKAENDELRKNLVDKHTSRCFRLVTHREFDKLIMETVQLRQENKKLKQTLTEIKEIAEHCIKQDICTFCDYSDKCYIEDAEIPTYDVCKLILQKISECEVE